MLLVQRVACALRLYTLAFVVLHLQPAHVAQINDAGLEAVPVVLRR